MRKHFLILMLLTLLPLAGWAQGGGILLDNSYFKYENYVYQVKHAPIANGAAGEAWLVGVRNGNNPVDATGKLCLPENGTFTINVLEDNYSLVVTQIANDALRYNFDVEAGALVNKGEFAGKITATSVVIPKTITTIQANTFVGYTNLREISFEENSEVETIAGGAFTTTQLSTFDFSNCSKLTTIDNGLFVEPGYTNSYVTQVTLPEASEALTTIGTAFKNLPNLTAINNLDKSLITTLVSESFSGDAKLETLALPATIETIAENAFQGSGVKNLTIDVTSMDDATAGNIYGTSFATLETLTLKGVLSGTFKPSAFAGCTSLESVTMNDATKPFVITGGTIGANAFNGCTSLVSLTFNDITEGTIGASAFNGCTALTSVVFGDITGTELVDALIDDEAFAGCKKLATITFGDLEHVTIDASAFKLTAVPTATATALTFGALTDVDINESAFEGFTKMNSISFGAADRLTINDRAFAGCTSGLATTADASLTFSTLDDVTIKASAATKGAFYNTTKLNAITFGESNGLTIEGNAFEKTASAGKAATVTFGDAKDLLIGASAFTGIAMAETITFGDIEDLAPLAASDLGTNAFNGATILKTLTFGDLTNVTISTNAFYGASSALTGTNVATATFGNLKGSNFENNVFDGAAKLQTVTIGDVTDGSAIGVDNVVFPAVKTVTIGAVKSTTDATVINTGAFVFANVSGATLSLANNKSLETVAAATNALVAAGSFDFSAVAGTTATFVDPVVTIGEIKTAEALAAGALVGNAIEKIVFNGAIAAGALNNMIIDDNDDDTTDTDPAANLTLTTLEFNGEIATGGIAANAFANLPEKMTITFAGKLAAGAIAAGAFEGLVGDAPALASTHSRINYTYNGTDIDLTVNPFNKRAFNNTTDLSGAADIAAIDALLPRQIQLFITNEALKAKFFEETPSAGLGTDGAFDIYRVIVAMPLPPAPDDFTFLVYPQLYASSTTAASPRTAWARWELGARVAEGVTGTLAAGTDLVIKRVQEIDGTNKAKITIYGTYTDEDDAMETATVYMVPLKAKNGFYHISGTNKTTLIVKVENAADFTETSYKVECNHAGAGTAADPAWPAYDATVCTDDADVKNGSIWPGLLNKELFVASQIMTNQQLVDKSATDPANAGGGEAYGYYHNARNANDINIYRGTTAIAEDLYIMSDPSKNKGFRIDMMPISSSNNAYINTGWYYMLLKKYKDLTTTTAAHVVWLDDATEGEITGILTVKDNAKNVAAKSEGIYTLQGVRVSEMQKGNIYIVNGKKYIAK